MISPFVFSILKICLMAPLLLSLLYLLIFRGCFQCLPISHPLLDWLYLKGKYAVVLVIVLVPLNVFFDKMFKPQYDEKNESVTIEEKINPAK